VVIYDDARFWYPLAVSSLADLVQLHRHVRSYVRSLQVPVFVGPLASLHLRYLLPFYWRQIWLHILLHEGKLIRCERARGRACVCLDSASHQSYAWP
jgi:hypothetical protein